MTVEDLRSRMSNQEYHQWRAFHTLRNQQRERARRQPRDG